MLSAMFDAAVEDELPAANPAHGLGKKHRLGSSDRDRSEACQALTQDELDRALTTAKARLPRLFPLFLVLARTGLRIGEALGLDDEDPEVFDFEARRLRKCPRCRCSGP